MKAKSRMKKMTNGDMEVTKVASADEAHMVAQEKNKAFATKSEIVK